MTSVYSIATQYPSDRVNVVISGKAHITKVQILHFGVT